MSFSPWLVLRWTTFVRGSWWTMNFHYKILFFSLYYDKSSYIIVSVKSQIPNYTEFKILISNPPLSRFSPFDDLHHVTYIMILQICIAFYNLLKIYAPPHSYQHIITVVCKKQCGLVPFKTLSNLLVVVARLQNASSFHHILSLRLSYQSSIFKILLVESSCWFIQITHASIPPSILLCT